MSSDAPAGDLNNGAYSSNPSCGKPKLFLHIGTHKTGTTSIQKFAASHRSELRKLGLVYPALKTKQGPRNPGHHHLAHALSDEASPSVSRIDALEFLKAVRDDVAEGESILLSAEPFYRHVLNFKEAGDYWEAKQNYIRYIAEVLADFDVTIVVVFRRLDKFIQSLYRESVLQSRYTEGIQEFVKERDSTLDYVKHLELWEGVFGYNSVLLDLYDENVRGRATVDAFFSRMGFDTSSILGKHAEEANISLPAKMVEIKRRLNLGPFKGRQSLKLRQILEDLADDDDFMRIVEDSFAMEQVPFQESEAFRLRMNSLFDRLPDRDRAQSMISGWMTNFDQPRPNDEMQVSTLVGTILSMARSHFRKTAEEHKAYAQIFSKIGRHDHAARALERALEYAPQEADYYLALLNVLGEDSVAARQKVLRNASKEMSDKAYSDLSQKAGEA